MEEPDHALLPENKAPFTVERVAQFVRKYMVGVASTPSAFESCIYTVSQEIRVVLLLFVVVVVF